jgi:hypothetical protein
MRISACAVANDCRPVAAIEAGCSATNLSVTPGAASDTVSAKPASTRCAAIGEPMLPRPMKPTRVMVIAPRP